MHDFENDYDDLDIIEAKVNEKLDIAIKRLIMTPESFTCLNKLDEYANNSPKKYT
jgi:hypothetical protein